MKQGIIKNDKLTEKQFNYIIDYLSNSSGNIFGKGSITPVSVIKKFYLKNKKHFVNLDNPTTK